MPVSLKQRMYRQPHIRALCSLIFILVPVLSPASVLIRKTEPVILNNDDRRMIASALEELEKGLSGKIDPGTVTALRYVGADNPPFFTQGYPAGAINNVYSRLREVHCQENAKTGASWQCDYSGKALVFSVDGTDQTVWLGDKVDYSRGMMVMDFLKTVPLHDCTAMRMTREPCEESFNREKLKTIRSIRYSYGDDDTLDAGDDRLYPGLTYQITPAGCEHDPCPYKINGTTVIMY